MIQKYSSDEARKLKQYGELPETAKINETDVYGGEDGDDMVDFGEVSGEDEGPLNGAVPESDSDESIGGGKDDFDIVRQLCRGFFFFFFPFPFLACLRLAMDATRAFEIPTVRTAVCF